MNLYKITDKDIVAIKTFEERYPNWWYKIGVCDLTRDFDCAPLTASPQHKYIIDGVWNDDCFMCDHHGSIADAVYSVMDSIEKATFLANQGQVKIDIRMIEGD